MDEPLNPGDPVDAKLLSLKNEIESSPDWPQRKAEIERENFISPGSQTENTGAPVDRDAERNARLKAQFEAGQKTASQTSEGEPGPGYEAAKESFRQDLGMDSGPEFEAHVSNMNTWVNETFSSVSEFDKLAAAAEEALGVKGAAELAIKLATAHVARKRR
jgi:hypothetical protein